MQLTTLDERRRSRFALLDAARFFARPTPPPRSTACPHTAHTRPHPRHSSAPLPPRRHPQPPPRPPPRRRRLSRHTAAAARARPPRSTPLHHNEPLYKCTRSRWDMIGHSAFPTSPIVVDGVGLLAAAAAPRRAATRPAARRCTAAAAATQRPARPAALERDATTRPRRARHVHRHRRGAPSTSTTAAPLPRRHQRPAAPASGAPLSSLHQAATRGPSKRSRCTHCSRTSHPSPSIHYRVLCPITVTPTQQRAANHTEPVSLHAVARLAPHIPRCAAVARAVSTVASPHAAARDERPVAVAQLAAPANRRACRPPDHARRTHSRLRCRPPPPPRPPRRRCSATNGNKRSSRSAESRRLSCLVSSSPPVLSSCPDQLHLAPNAPHTSQS